MNAEMNEIGELHATASHIRRRPSAGRPEAQGNSGPIGETSSRISGKDIAGIRLPSPASLRSAGSLHAFSSSRWRLGGYLTSLTIDAVPSFSYKPPMICAFPRLMATTDSRGLAVGPEGMRVR